MITRDIDEIEDFVNDCGDRFYGDLKKYNDLFADPSNSGILNEDFEWDFANYDSFLYNKEEWVRDVMEEGSYVYKPDEVNVVMPVDNKRLEVLERYCHSYLDGHWNELNHDFADMLYNLRKELLHKYPQLNF